MGGHQSIQSVDVSSTIVTDQTLDVTQDCTATMAGSQVMTVSGNNNVFTDNRQDMTMSVDMRCVDSMDQSAKFSSKINDNIKQYAENTDIAGLGWLDAGKDTAEANIVNNVTTNVTFDDTQNCMTALNGQQIMSVQGSGNVFSKNVQDQSYDMTKSCLMSGGQYSKVVNNFSDIVNQHSVYAAENFFAFIPDAIEATIVDSAAIAAIALIVIVILVLAFKALTSRKARAKKKGKEAPALEPAAAGPAAV